MKGKVLAAGIVAVSLMMAPVAHAADGLTDIEQKWLALHKAVTDQLVKDGKLTRQDADSRIAAVEKKLSQPGDSVYERFSNKGDHKKDCRGKEDLLAKDYAKMTGRTVEEVRKACEDGGLTVWQLAEKEGKLDSFKSLMLSNITSRLDGMVKDGKLTAQQRDDKLKKITDKLGKMS